MARELGTGPPPQPAGGILETLSTEKPFVSRWYLLPQFSAFLPKPPPLQPAPWWPAHREASPVTAKSLLKRGLKLPLQTSHACPENQAQNYLQSMAVTRPLDFCGHSLNILFLSLPTSFLFVLFCSPPPQPEGCRALRRSVPGLGPFAGVSPEVGTGDRRVTSLPPPAPHRRPQLQHRSQCRARRVDGKTGWRW